MPEWKPAYLTTPVTASLIFLSVINLLVSPCSILLNILVIVAVKTSPRLKTNHHILMASLAGTDLLTGAISQPLVIAEEIYLLKGKSVNSYSVCFLRNVSAITAVTPVIASLQHLALLSIERYLAITYPFKYLELITELRLTASVVTVWAVATLLTVRTSVYTVNNAFILNFRRVIMYVHDGMPEWQPSYLTTLVTASMIFISVINLIVSPCTMVLNALVMIAVKTSPRLKSNYHILLASLAGTDLMTGAMAQPPVVVEQIYRLSGNSAHFYKVCLLNNISRITGVYFITASILHLMLLSVERYVTITYPYKYLEIMTKRRLISSAVFAWSFAALTVVLSVKDIFPFSFRALLIVISISILIFCHIAVYRETRAQMRKIKSQQVSKEAREVFLKEKKAMNTTKVIIGVV
ncbi:unnamed protein product, partial [Porites evermanni]